MAPRGRSASDGLGKGLGVSPVRAPGALDHNAPIHVCVTSPRWSSMAYEERDYAVEEARRKTPRRRIMSARTDHGLGIK